MSLSRRRTKSSHRAAQMDWAGLAGARVVHLQVTYPALLALPLSSWMPAED